MEKVIRKVDTINICFFISSSNIVFVQSLFSTVLVIIFIPLKDGAVAFLCGTFQGVRGFCASMHKPFVLPRDSPFSILKAGVVKRSKF